jgi:hypothetical protein
MVNPGYSILKQISAWPAINKDGLQKWMASNLRYTSADLQQKAVGTCDLKPHQHLVKDFLQQSSPYRSLLLYQGLGTGKTRASIAVAEMLSSQYKIAVFVPASLEANYITEIINCGNNDYKRSGLWRKSTADKDKAKILKEGGAPRAIKQNMGVWIKSNIGRPFDALSLKEQEEITRQIYTQVSNRYSFIHYNGLRSIQKVKELLVAHNYFKDYVVVIDEVHNFISKVVNKSPIITLLYSALLTQSDCKMLLLSGTPIINKPIEVGKIANLARGELESIVFNIPSNQFCEAMREALDNNPAIDYYDLNSISGKIQVVPLPKGFVKNGSGYLVQDTIQNPGVAGLSLMLEEAFQNIGISSITKTTLKSRLFPEDEQQFEELFVDYRTAQIKNPLMFTRRVQGLVSYFETYDESQYPRVSNIQEVRLPLSEEAFTAYLDVRQTEMLAENRAIKRRNGKGLDMNSSSYYRFLSRAVCNFQFPKDITRPRPSLMKSLLKEIEIPEEESKDIENVANEADTDVKDTPAKVYESFIRKSLNMLKESDALNPGNLEKYSPKFNAIIDNLNGTMGSALVYSSFRTVEGLGILKLALQAQGYTGLDVKEDAQTKTWYIHTKDFSKPHYIEFSSESKERTNILLNLFNNAFSELPPPIQQQLKEHNISTNLRGEFIKLIMITQSGAEGISLKNVRTVHIMEPYWNNVRIKQVIGRAVRAGSHLALPGSERNVQVYMYLSVFDVHQKENDLARNRENGITSDEYILQVAQKKASITDGFLNILKSSSIDCRINHIPSAPYQCTILPKNLQVKNRSILYDAEDATNDIPNAKLMPRIKSIVTTRRLGRIQKMGETTIYYYDKDTLELLDNTTKMVIGMVIISDETNSENQVLADVVLFE